jgi:hypothetical protein
MRVRRSLPALLALSALILTPVMADEIVYFTNGTSLPISSHKVEKEMISVDLGADSRMGFPLYMVDKIESSGQNVYLNPVYHPANQAVAGAAGGPASGSPSSTLITGAGSVPSRFRSPIGSRPGGNDGSAAQSNIAAGEQPTGNARFPVKTGNRAAIQEQLQRQGLSMPLAVPGRAGGNRGNGGPVRLDVQRDGSQQQSNTQPQQPAAEDQAPTEQQAPPEDDPS